MFWKLGWTDRRTTICNLCERLEVKRRRGKGQHKNKQCSFEYHLVNESSINVKVCKQFFLTTLGFSKTNDRVVFDVLSKTVGELTPPSNKWHNKKCVNVELHDLVSKHIESFNPTISHYRREHVPNVRYLPSDVNITSMHTDFNEKNPDSHVSYDFYRLKIKEKHISFAILGHEECESCESSCMTIMKKI